MQIMDTEIIRNNVFMIEDWVMSTPNAPPLSSFPSQRIASESPLETQTRNFSIDMYPQLAFVPTTIHWHGPLLERFAYMFDSFPIIKGVAGYQLSIPLAERWARTEQALRLMVQILCTHSGTCFPLDFSYYPLPSSFGYLRPHRTIRTARKCAKKSRDAFLPLMAMASYTCAITLKDRLADDPPWVKILVDHRMHPEWVELARRSPIGDFSDNVTRAGVIIDVSTCKWIRDAPRYIRANVPVWFRWSRIHLPLQAAPHQHLQKYFPTREQVTNAWKWQQESALLLVAQNQSAHLLGDRGNQDLFRAAPPSSGPSRLSPPLLTQSPPQTIHLPPSPTRALHALPPPTCAPHAPPLPTRVPHAPPLPTHAPYAPPSPTRAPHAPPPPTRAPPSLARSAPSPVNSPAPCQPTRNPPKPAPNSRQRQGETWQDFFARQAVRHAKIADRETETEREARLARQKDSEKFNPPGRKGATVFQWLDVDGFLIRTEVFRKHVQDIWDDTPTAHMRYNAFDREWDICEEFDLSVPAGIDADAEFYGDSPPQMRNYYLPTMNELPPVEDNVPMADVEGVEDGELDGPMPSNFTETAPVTEPSIDYWREELFSMYGQQDYNDGDVYQSPIQFTESLDMILYERFGFDWDLDLGDSGSVPSAGEWKKDCALVVQDAVSWVNDDYKRPIINFLRSLLGEPMDRLTGMSWDLRSTSHTPLRDIIGQYFEVVQQVVDENVVFFIRPNSRTPADAEWDLAVHDPAAALQCIRSSSSNICDVARRLLKTGVPFNTFILSPLPPAVALPPSLPSTPFPGLGVRFPGYKPDAADYISYQAQLGSFLRQPHARAALLKGGIVWRLAMEFLGPQDVLVGPSEQAFTRHQQSGLYDDDLTDDELNLICGVYKVYTGELTHV